MPKPLNTEALDRALNNINKAAEAAKTASASAVKKKKRDEQESPYARHLEQIRQAAEAQNLYSQTQRQQTDTGTGAYAKAVRKPSAHSGSARNVQNTATPFSVLGVGDQPLDARQGRELVRQGKNLYAARQRQEQERMAQEAQQGRDLMREARRISDAYDALQDAPQGVQNALGNVYGAAEERESGLSGSPYADVMRREDYGRLSKAGESRLGLGADTDRTYDYINDINGFRARADEQAVMMDDAQRLGKYGLMTDDEIGVYNYLYATRGRESAERYLTELEPELNRQYYSGLKNSTLEDVDDGEAGLSWNEAGASAITVLEQPNRSIKSALANIEDAYNTMTGKGIDPYSQNRTASRLTQDVREAISDDMGEVGSFAYQTAMSALDSAMNAIVAKGLGGMTGAEGDALMKATNIIGSLTMSSEVASTAIAESKEKGYSDAGALTLGLVRGGIEYMSEKIGGEWVIKNIKANPLNFMKTMALNMIPEGVEEVMSDAMNGAVNLIVDNIFGTKESGLTQLIEHFRTEGTPAQKKNPELWAALSILGDEVLSFLGGALATVGSSGTQYATNRASISRTARVLNTSAENVAQLINTYDAESAGEIEVLAEFLDAESVEDFKAKMADYENAKAAVDAVMTGQVGNENAPAGAAEAEVSAAQTGTEGAQIENEGAQNENGNAQNENGNAQIENGNAQNENGNAQIENGNAQNENGNAQIENESTKGKRIVQYNDTQNRNAIQKETHERMLQNGNVVDLTEAYEANGEFFPDLRDKPRKERFAILDKMKAEVKNILNNYLGELRNVAYEFDINGETIEAKLYGPGIREVLKGLNREKVSMLGTSDQLFRSAEYMYSANAEHGNKNATGYDYFYVPVKIGNEVFGVRIAIQNLSNTVNGESENHIYDWGIKKDETESMTRGDRSKNAPSTDFGPLETVSSKDSIRPSDENSNPQNEGGNSQAQEAAENGAAAEGGEQGDSAYLKAVKNGDADQAREMVNAAARSAGYDTFAFHGGTGMNHTEYNNGAIWFTDSQSAASTYANDSEEILTPKNGSEKRSGIYRAALKLGNSLEIDADGAAHDNIKPWKAIPELQKLRSKETSKEYWDALEWFERELGLDREDLSHGITTDALAEYARLKGYDSITIKNVADEHYSEKGAERHNTAEPATVYVVFDGSRFKSADPVTYNNNGDVIPLSQRFNSTGKDIRGNVEGSGEKDSSAAAQKDSSQRTATEDTAAGASGELETRESVEEAKADLLEVGEGRVKNDTGEYRMTIRRKNDGHYLAAVERNGRRINAKTFGTAAEAAEWAAGTVDGQTRWQMDAEMDKHKSQQKKGPTLTQQLFGQFDPEAEAKRQKENRAAEAATQTLRSRVKNTQEEINALNRLERTTGLTEAQRSHRADLQQTLEIMNDELESRKKKRGEAKAGERVEAKGNKPTQSVADARRTIMDLFHTPEGVRQEAGAAIQERLEAMLRDGRVDEQSKQTLFGALMEAGMVPKAADPTFRQIREDLNGTRIFVNEQERADIGDNWKDLYQKAWGARIFLTSNPTDVKIDAVNGQMAETYGESMFPTDAALSDMLENLIEKANRGRDSQQKLTDAIEDEARYTDTDIDKIYEDMYSRLDSELRTFAEKAGLEVALKNKAAGDMATERKRWEDRMERKAQERRESKIREKVLKGLQKLERLRGKSAPEVRAQIDEVLKDIDTQARSLTPYGIENLQALREVYEEKARQEGFVDDDNPGNFIRNPYVEEKIGRLEKMHLNEMDIADVIELGNTVAGLVHAVQTANQMIGEEFDAGVKETAEAARKEIQASRGARPGFLQKWFAEEQLSPRRFLELLGGWKNGVMKKLAASLENGQTRMLDFQRRAMQSFDTFMSKEENRKWLETASGKNAKWSTYSVVNGMDMEGKSGYTGQSIEITPMMKIALFLHSLNNDNLRHIQTGGLVIPDKALYQKGKIAEAYAQGQKVKMQPEAVRAIASTLTPEETTFAGYLQKFFNEQSKAAINEVSMQLDGFERAGVDNYFPIETDSSFLRSDVAGEARAATVEGIGSIANERVHAGNPIRLCDASDVLARQIDKVSRYYGYAIPIRNFQAVNNYTFHEEGNAFAGSIKDSMNKKWGSGAQQYITKMLADLQSGGGTKTDMMSRGLAWLRGNLAGATLSINPSVAVSQTASYPGAAQVVGWDGLAAGLAGGKVDEKLIEKYTPLLWYRSQGYSTQELGDAKAAANKTLGQKALSSKWLNWIQGMDRATVKRLWAAAEYRVRKDTGMKPGSKAQIDAGTDPYYKAVAEVFNRAVYDTQPNYTNMERAQILRSDSQLTKMLTMYKTVPLQYYGMMYEAMGRLRAAQNGTEAEQKAARKYAADTVSGLIAANTLYVAVKAAFKGLRRKDDDYRDDEGELTAESVTKQLGKDLLETTAGSIIGGAEAYSIIDGWFHGKKFSAPDISALSHAEDVINDINNIFKAIDADDPRKTAGAVKTAAETLAMTWGIPVKNAETYLTALIGRAWPKAAMEYNNLFGGIDKSDIKKLDDDTVGMAANIIMRNRTGVQLDRAATDELSRLYKAGYNTAIPTEIPESFSYGGNEVKIKDRGAYGDTWGGVVGDNLEELLTSESYEKANDKTKAAMVNHLYQYATVQARMGADPEYSAEGNSTYGWTVKADEAVEAGIDLSTAIGALVTMNGMTADKEAGRTVVSKKSKVVDYIDGLDLDEEQKDLLYEMAGYTSGLEYAPWHTGISAEAGYTSGIGPKVHEGTKKEVIAQYSDALTGSTAYKAADDQTKKAMVKLLQDYATAQGMKKTDPSWTPAGTDYNWTTWADTAVKAGIELPAAIAAKIELGKMKADYDDYGKAITGSKKEKVCAYIDGLDLTPEQKDVLYLSVYKENSLQYTPWHGYEKKSGSRRGGSGGRRGGRSGRRTSSGSAKISAVSARPGRSTGGGIDASKLFGVKAPGKIGGDASRELLEIIDRYYGGDAWAAAMDGGQKAKGRTTIDFKI